MIWMRICEAIAAATLGAAVVLVAVVAFCRYVLSFTPVWSEPVVGLLIFMSVCAALAPGLRDGVHVAIHLLDLMGERWTRWRRGFGWLLCCAFGVAMAISAFSYTLDMWGLGLADYSGMPQWIPASGALLFGVVLAVYSLYRAMTSLRQGEAL